MELNYKYYIDEKEGTLYISREKGMINTYNFKEKIFIKGNVIGRKDKDWIELYELLFNLNLCKKLKELLYKYLQIEDFEFRKQFKKKLIKDIEALENFIKEMSE